MGYYNNDDKPEGGTVTLPDVKIPRGNNCLKCKAKHPLIVGKTGWTQGMVCVLYMRELQYHERQMANARNTSEYIAPANVYEKCESCRSGRAPVFGELQKAGNPNAK